MIKEDFVAAMEFYKSQILDSTEPLPAVPGFSPQALRLLLNFLPKVLAPETRYLEIGTFYGASLSAVLSGNQTVEALSIDHLNDLQGERLRLFVQQGVPPPVVWVSTPDQRRWINEVITTTGFGNAVFWEIDSLKLMPYRVLYVLPEGVNLFFYDGNHSYHATFHNLIRFLPCCNNQTILVVDDITYDLVLPAVEDALDVGRWDVLSSYRLETSGDEWGFAVYLISRRSGGEPK